MSDFLAHILSAEPGFEREVVDRYTRRLLEFARRKLPNRLRRRVDPEDIVQSVYRSFFHRLNEGQFTFQESLDVWRLLAAMTFHKARNAVKFHERERRDVRRDLPLVPDGDSSNPNPEAIADTPGSDDLEILYECLDKLLAKLPSNYREIVVARLQGESIEQIAQKVKRSRRTVLRVLAHLQELGASELEGS